MRNPPIIVGGTGGSGTRVVQALLEHAGIFMGKRLNEPKDAMDFDEFFANSIPQILRETRRVDYRLEDLPQPLVSRKLTRLREIARKFRADCPDDAAGWGFKHPRSIFMLPFLQRIFPNLSFVHVLRDGRDMATSKNQNQLLTLYKPLYGKELPKDLEAASAQMWQKVNLERTRWALRNLPGRYHLLRFEDLCRQPESEAQRLFETLKLKVDEDGVHAACEEVESPASVGRHKKLTPAKQQKLAEIAGPGLLFYNYLPL